LAALEQALDPLSAEQTEQLKSSMAKTLERSLEEQHPGSSKALAEYLSSKIGSDPKEIIESLAIPTLQSGDCVVLVK
jgi:hypothetical protein